VVKAFVFANGSKHGNVASFLTRQYRGGENATSLLSYWKN